MEQEVILYSTEKQMIKASKYVEKVRKKVLREMVRCEKKYGISIGDNKKNKIYSNKVK